MPQRPSKLAPPRMAPGSSVRSTSTSGRDGLGKAHLHFRPRLPRKKPPSRKKGFAVPPLGPYLGANSPSTKIRHTHELLPSRPCATRSLFQLNVPGQGSAPAFFACRATTYYSEPIFVGSPLPFVLAAAGSAKVKTRPPARTPPTRATCAARRRRTTSPY